MNKIVIFLIFSLSINSWADLTKNPVNPEEADFLKKVERPKIFCAVYFKENPKRKFVLNGEIIESVNEDEMYLINGYLEKSEKYKNLDIYKVRHKACSLLREDIDGIIEIPKKIIAENDKNDQKENLASADSKQESDYDRIIREASVPKVETAQKTEENPNGNSPKIEEELAKIPELKVAIKPKESTKVLSKKESVIQVKPSAKKEIKISPLVGCSSKDNRELLTPEELIFCQKVK